MTDIDDLLDDVRAHGFDSVGVIPLCFLPNQCVDVWKSSFSTFHAVTEVDAFWRDRVAPESVQVYFVQCEKA